MEANVHISRPGSIRSEASAMNRCLGSGSPVQGGFRPVVFSAEPCGMEDLGGIESLGNTELDAIDHISQESDEGGS